MADDTPRPLMEMLKIVRGDLEPQIETVGLTKTRHYDHIRTIFEDRNIVGVGIANKISNTTETGDLSLCFYVEKKLPKAKLASGRLIPPVLSTIRDEAIFTDVQEVGLIRPEINKRAKPIQSGFSVGHVRAGAGTVGAIVKKGRTFFILSNSHVLARSGKAKVGDRIAYPGPADSDARKQIVATLSEFVPFQHGEDLVNAVDAALAEIVPEWRHELDLAIPSAKLPLAAERPRRGMAIIKEGRTTGRTVGVVQDVNFSVVITYPGVGKVGFIDQVKCSRYTEPGDSGALVLNKDTGKVVGLHFSGSRNTSIFNPIGPVKKALKFRFASR